MTALFRSLFYSPVGLRDERYTSENLALLTADELAALCQVMGIPHTGSKQRKVERIMTARGVRLLLARYQPDDGGEWSATQTHRGRQIHHTSTPTTRMVQRLADDYSGRDLHDLCRKIGAYPAPTKYGKAAALIQWRNECRVRGKAVLDEARTAAWDHTSHAVQRYLFGSEL
jgi:hypothetical protein